ncbi:hypothetical protein [Herbaspirillum robiniae]|uniref:hypothetical protein n=1 Tax=Herbaspirillum robiniae TaxID=2014887 RepID=UPI003D77631E
MQINNPQSKPASVEREPYYSVDLSSVEDAAADLGEAIRTFLQEYGDYCDVQKIIKGVLNGIWDMSEEPGFKPVVERGLLHGTMGLRRMDNGICYRNLTAADIEELNGPEN